MGSQRRSATGLRRDSKRGLRSYQYQKLRKKRLKSRGKNTGQPRRSLYKVLIKAEPVFKEAQESLP